MHIYSYASRRRTIHLHSSASLCHAIPLQHRTVLADSIPLQYESSPSLYITGHNISITVRYTAYLFPYATHRLCSIPLLFYTSPNIAITAPRESSPILSVAVQSDSIPFHDNTKLRHQRYSLTYLHSAFPLPFHTVPVLCLTVLFQNPSMPHDAVAKLLRSSPFLCN